MKKEFLDKRSIFIFLNRRTRALVHFRFFLIVCGVRGGPSHTRPDFFKKMKKMREWKRQAKPFSTENEVQKNGIPCHYFTWFLITNI